MCGMISAIEYCHQHKIVHRDIKPENIIINNENVQLIDFDLAIEVPSSCPTQMYFSLVCGSIPYIPPEFMTQSMYGFPTDCWGIGCILYLLLVGSMPFASEKKHFVYYMERIKIQHIKDKVNYKKNLFSLEKNILLHLLHPNWKKRITIIDLKKHPWFTKYTDDTLQ
jgi:serine/threonine protein kinase